MPCSQRVICAAGLCDLHTVIESGAALGICCSALPRSEAGISSRIFRGATALDKRPQCWLSSLPPPTQRPALLPIWSLNMQDVVLPPIRHLKTFQRGIWELMGSRGRHALSAWQVVFTPWTKRSWGFPAPSTVCNLSHRAAQ